MRKIKVLRGSTRESFEIRCSDNDALSIGFSCSKEDALKKVIEFSKGVADFIVCGEKIIVDMFIKEKGMKNTRKSFFSDKQATTIMKAAVIGMAIIFAVKFLHFYITG